MFAVILLTLDELKKVEYIPSLTDVKVHLNHAKIIALLYILKNVTFLILTLKSKFNFYCSVIFYLLILIILCYVLQSQRAVKARLVTLGKMVILSRRHIQMTRDLVSAAKIVEKMDQNF